MKNLKNKEVVFLRIIAAFIFSVLSFVGCHDDQFKDPLTKEERNWLARNDGKIVLGHDPSANPIEFIDEKGEFRGLAADYVKLIENNLNFKFKIVNMKTWDEVVKKARNKEVDVLCAFTKNSEREKWMLFTEPYIEVPTVILTRKDDNRNLSLDKMKNMKVTFTKGWIIDDFLRNNYRDLIFVPAINDKIAMNNLSTGQADAWVTALTVASIEIEKNRITNLRIAGEADLSFKLAFASRKDLPILNQILSKGLNTISPQEREAIFRKWIHIEAESILYSKKFWISVFIIIAILLLSVIFIIVWNKTLKQEVDRQTNALKYELEARKKVEETLRQSENQYRMLIENLPQKIFHKDTNSVYITCNENLARDLNILPHEITGKTDYDFFSEEMAEKYRQDDQRIIRSGETEEIIERYIINDQEYVVQTVKTVIRDTAGNISGLLGIFWDITDRVQAEKEIRKKNEQLIEKQREIIKSEALFRGLFDNMTSGSAIYEVINDGSKGTDYIIRGFNNKSLELEGKTLDEVIGKSLFDLRPTIDDYGLISIMKKVWETGVSAYFPIKIYQDKKFSNYYENYVFKIPSGEIVTIYNDVTAQKNAEIELKASKEQFELAMRFVNDGLFDWNLETNEIYYSPVWKKLLGYENDEIKNEFSEWERLTSPQDVKDSLIMLNEVLEGKRERFEKEFKMLHKNGHWVDILSRAKIVCDKTGKAIRVVGTHLDITQRKQAEKELQQLRDLLTNIIDSMPSILVGVDGNGIITQWNRQAENVTGTRAEKACGQLLSEVFPRLAPEMKKVRSAIETREIQKDLRVESLVNGKTHFSDVIVYPLISDNSEGAVIRVDDVTERVRIEEVMIQTEKMMSLGGLAAGTAHEINNPLSGILHGVQNIIRRISPDFPRNIQIAKACGTDLNGIRYYMEKRDILKFLDGITNSGKRAADIVANMLQFSRSSESKMAPANLPELLDKTIELAKNDYDLKKKYDFRQIQIVREYDASVPEVPCEATKIQQVFFNILKNGAQAMAENRKEEKLPCFILRIISEEDAVRVEIEDNGPGMSASVRKRIFEPFYTTKAVGIGTGLGLSVSYFIITENHKGTMHVESTPGQGAKFIIRLPKSRKCKDV